MTRILIQLAAASALLVFLWSAFRYAMGLRWGRVQREQARRQEEARGRRIIAELPSRDGTLGLFTDDGEAFFWPGARVGKGDIVGCRLLLNGGVIASAARPEAHLPEPLAGEEYEGRERWDVRLYLIDAVAEIPCGSVREGISREIARSVFEAVRASLPAIR
jgi:hypothetical protein